MATQSTFDRSNKHGISDSEDVPIPYMQRGREWYRALGTEVPYRWAHHRDVPFQPLLKPLDRTTVALLTTAAPYQPGKGDQGPGAPYNAAAKFHQVYARETSTDHDMRISHVGIDRVHTSMEDSGTWFPLPLMRERVAAGRIGALAPRFYGVPTNLSQRHTMEVDVPDILERCRTDGVEAALLVPNCPVCHQTMSLVARALEQAGIPTVVMGVAKDIVEYVGVPRFLFSDFPLGNSAGRPHDRESQAYTLELALKVLEGAPGPRTTVQSPLLWAESADWKSDYRNLERLTPEQLVQLREAKARADAVAKQLRVAAFATKTHQGGKDGR